MRSGWTLALEMLKIYVEEHFGEEKRSLLVLREAGCCPRSGVALVPC